MNQKRERVTLNLLRNLWPSLPLITRLRIAAIAIKYLNPRRGGFETRPGMATRPGILAPLNRQDIQLTVENPEPRTSPRKTPNIPTKALTRFALYHAIITTIQLLLLPPASQLPPITLPLILATSFCISILAYTVVDIILIPKLMNSYL